MRLRASFSSTPLSALEPRDTVGNPFPEALDASGLRHWPCASGRAPTKQGDLAANAIAGGQFAASLGHCAAQKLLVDLGQFAGYHDAQRGSPYGFQIGQRLQNPVRRLVKDQCPRRPDF